MSLFPRAISVRPASAGSPRIRFLRASELPRFESYVASLRSAWPNASFDVSRTLYGPSVALVESVSGVGVRLELLFAKGRRSRVAIARFVVAVPTRGMDVEASPHRNMPTRLRWQSFRHPALAISGLLIAPASLRAVLFDASIEELLASLLGSDDDPPELRIADDRIELELTGWPPDADTIARGFALMADLARRTDQAGIELAGGGGDFANHPEVIALRELRASRQRIGRMILLGLAVVVMIVIAGVIASIANHS